MSRMIGLILLAAISCCAWSAAASGEVKDTALISEKVALASSAKTDTAPLKEAVEEPISLSRDSEGTVLRSFTIEGEDRVSIRFARPGITLDLDPRTAPGLGWKNSWEKVDVFPAVTSQSALAAPPFTGRPWLQEFAQDDVVVFNPEAPDMTSWKLTIVDSRGKPAVVRQGQGAPPTSLAWNGRRDEGDPAWPGLTYSYVMGTVDPAGNQRTFSGRGFGLPPYRLTGEQEDVLVFSGSEIINPETGTGSADLNRRPLLIETASWLNQASGLTTPIEIRATARNNDQARQLAGLVSGALTNLVCGDPARILTVIKVMADAPDQGVLEIASRPHS